LPPEGHFGRAHAAHLFFQIVSRRYEKGSMLITTNQSVAQWASSSATT
jgi:DNA replication protein DnaC